MENIQENNQEKRVISKANLKEIRRIINERFLEFKQPYEIRKEILDDIEIHFTSRK